jgi:activator of 2-hydroxyglutaryl-CoA dehydratase
MVLSGGLSVSGGLAKILGQTLGQSVYPLSQGLYSGAIGAALLAMDLK